MSEKEIPFGKIKDGKIFLNAWGEYPEREIGEVREDEESSVKYFEERFEELVKKIDDLEKEIQESQNKGSFLMKLKHLKTQLSEHDGLGDYSILEERLTKQEAHLEDIIQKNRERNSEIKKSLLEEIKAAADKINWKEATLEIHEIKARWIKTGNPKEEEQEQLEEDFWGVIEAFFEKKKEFYEDKKRLGDLRKKEYEDIIERTKTLENLHGKARFDKVAELKQAWKDVGNIPKEEYTELLKTFNYKLKPKRPRVSSFTPSIDIEEIIKNLNEFIDGSEVYNFKKLDEIKNTLKNFRPNDFNGKNAKREAFTKVQLLMERDFIDKIANKRFKNFRELEKAKKRQIRIGILEELISRDQTDLEKYQENSANFSSSGNGGLGFIEKKLAQQEAKIKTKTQLLQLMKEEK
ncbi:MAG: hypothetical protein CMB80_15215 [Flammeovirgaceae bacterium]|nr:hypothetical protein [Flammeovirgaceae bacterium]HCX22287.1 hypothetical protein [Cytophagales bacterium]